ncbi:MAG: OprD family outer membrane porin [Campylobacterales bacterium]|nr:OprD family outer membrane porin [Campylobacterales bacterium]
MFNKKIAMSLFAVLALGSQTFAEEGFSGEARLGYQYTDVETEDSNEMAFGVKLSYESAQYMGLSLGGTLQGVLLDETPNILGVPFGDSQNESYGILNELYLKGIWGGSQIIVGRQTLETPYADSDDIGMVPNRFEAATYINSDIPDTTIVLSHVRSWSGVDAPVPEEFTKMNGSDGVQVAGITYVGIENLELQGWYYFANDVVDLAYLEASYGIALDAIEFSFGAQYSRQDYDGGDNNDIFGASVEGTHTSSGLGLAVAYNQTDGIAADNFFGGGPFFTSMEHYTLAEAGDNGRVYNVALSWDADAFVSGLAFGTGYAKIDRDIQDDAQEIDVSVEYAFNDNISATVVYSDISDDVDGDFQNLRAFVNYSF